MWVGGVQAFWEGGEECSGYKGGEGCAAEMAVQEVWEDDQHVPYWGCAEGVAAGALWAGRRL